LAARFLGQTGVALLGLCSIALLWGGILHTMAAERDEAIRGTYLNAANLARAFEENIVRSLKAADQTLLYVRDEYERDPARFDLARRTGSARLAMDSAFQIALIDRHGRMRESDLAAKGTPLDLSDREHFRVHVNNPRDELFISKPVFGRISQKWSIQLTRKMIAPDGSFDGVVVVSLDPGYLSRYYGSVDLGKEGVVVLLGTDGYFRARAGNVALAGGSALGRDGSQGPILRAWRQAPVGIFAGPSTVDGVARFYAYRGVDGYPLVLSVGFGQDEVLAAQHANRRGYCLLGGLVTALLLAVTAMLQVRQAQMNRARVRLRTEYARKSDLLEATLENMSQGIMMIGADGLVQVCNRRVIGTLALPEAVVAGTPAFDDVMRLLWERGEFGHDAPDYDAWRAGFAAAGTVADGVWMREHTRPDGTVLDMRARSMADGRIVRTFTDITARKRDEAVLRAALAEADRATRAKSAFLATMSHEIRSPMSGLLGVHDLLRATELTEDQRRMADMVHESAMMLLAVLNDILDFSKIEAGALAVAPEPTSPLRLAHAVVEPHGVPAAHKGVRVTLRVDPAVPDWVMTDGLRLRQILGNLMSNAVKFTAAGEISLVIDVPADTDPPVLRCTVRDSGIGMSEAVVARLFQPFMQADGSTTRNYGGTGLGLCISHQLAGLLGGELSVTSRVGEGSAFVLTLPLAPCAAPAAASVADAGGGPAAAPAPAGRRVLVVDDDKTNRWLAQRQFERMGFVVDVAENGEAALATLLASREDAGGRGPNGRPNGRYDLMVTDCHMPRMDGVALTQALRAAEDSVLRALPIIGLTADATEMQRERCRDAGMTELAIKPLTSERLQALVALVLAGKTAPPAPDAQDRDAQDGAVAALKAVAFDDTIYHEIFPPGDDDAAGAGWLSEFLETAHREDDDLGRRIAAAPDAQAGAAPVATTTHRLAGAAFSVGAMKLGQAAVALEQAALRGETAALAALHGALRAELQAAEAAITEFVSARTALQAELAA
jgi:signal transduction histidine kinase/CheY-like chemotaxis protein/HPt (histidine-containing phosphotransfer) domain-containing protein